MIFSIASCLIALEYASTEQYKISYVRSYEFLGSTQIYNMVEGLFVVSVNFPDPDAPPFLMQLYTISPVSGKIENVRHFEMKSQILDFDKSLEPLYWDRRSSPGHVVDVRNKVLLTQLLDGSVLTPLEKSYSREWELIVPFRVDEFTFNSHTSQLAIIRDDRYAEPSKTADYKARLDLYSCSTSSPASLISSYDLTPYHGLNIIGVNFIGPSSILFISVMKTPRETGFRGMGGDFYFYVLDLKSGKVKKVLFLEKDYDQSLFVVSDDFRYLLMHVGMYELAQFKIDADSR